MDVETTSTSRVEISGLRDGPTAAASRFGSYSSVTAAASQELCHLEASEAAGVCQGSVRWSWIAINYDHVQLRVGCQYSVTGLTCDVFSQRTFSCRTRAHDC